VGKVDVGGVVDIVVVGVWWMLAKVLQVLVAAVGEVA